MGVKLALFISRMAFIVNAAYESVSLETLDLNRDASQLSATELTKFPFSEFGFKWNQEDADSLKWRPQGITGITSSDSDREFIAASWYGREQEGYENRGVRIAFVDISNSSAIKYRHVLLVDENYDTFPSLHGGGLVYKDGLLHVPDSRSGTKKVFTFSVNDILYIPPEDRAEFYDYVYVMMRVSSYDVPITPSFLSFDFDKNQILLGTFYQCSDYHYDTTDCLAASQNTLMWYTINAVDSASPFCGPFYSEMQGAGTSTYNNSKLVWTTSSYGSGHDSHLHVSALSEEFECSVEYSASNPPVGPGSFTTTVYPPGLEDMHMADPASGLYSEHIWMMTEFGTNDGTNNLRCVFATNIQYLVP